MAYELPPLPYAYDALAPHISKETMELHHDKHHAAYVTNLNNALKDNAALASLGVDDLLRRIKEVPESGRTAVRNNGGGHSNHTMFWEIMGPNGGGTPAGELGSAINSAFGSFDAFKAAFNDAGVKRFGSGWVWLTLDGNSKLQISSSANQDSPLMESIYPIMGNDVWEHAYYVDYRNRRPDYLNAWWNVVNWDAVASRYAKARG